VYNGERYLGQTLDSVFAQSYRPIEVIVVDDGSTDGTAALLADREEQLVVVRQANAGPAAARNRGFKTANGDFVAFLDSDDTWDPTFLTNAYSAFVDEPDLDICLCHMKSVWTPELAELESVYADPRANTVALGSVTVAMLARRELFARVGSFDESLRTAEDQDWYLRAVESGARVHVLSEVLVNRRLHPSNMTRLEAGVVGDNLAALVKRSLDRRRGTGSGNPAPLNLPPGSRDR